MTIGLLNNPPRKRPLLIYRPSYRGGASAYSRIQAIELARRGEKVVVITTAHFLDVQDAPSLRAIRCLVWVPESLKSRWLRRLAFGLTIVCNYTILAACVIWLRPYFVLIKSFSQVLAPIWVLPHVALARAFGFIYVVTIHDPVRAPGKGPVWWHRLSVWAAYQPISIGLIHSADTKERYFIPQHVRLVTVPHGVFHLDVRKTAGQELRKRWAVDADAPLALAFGYVADRKNLDLIIRAMSQVPTLYCAFVGGSASALDRSPGFYEALSREVGVSERCRFVNEFIPDTDIDLYFSASDFVLLTYRGNFVSQSGVLNVAANYNKPVLASAARSSPLITAVTRFNLGLVIEPDSVEAVVDGFNRLLAGEPGRLGWDAFRAHASWERNVTILLDAVAAAGSNRVNIALGA